MYKPSRLDIGNIQRKSGRHTPTSAARKVFQAAPVIAKPKPKLKFSLVPFASLALAIIVMVQAATYLASARNASGEILGVATSAYADLNSAGVNLQQNNFDEAAGLFKSAQDHLTKAQDKMQPYRPLTYLTPQTRGANNILKGAYLLSAAGANLTQGLKLFDELRVSSNGVETESFTAKLIENHRLMTESLELLQQAKQYFAENNSLPKEYSSAVDQARRQVDTLESILTNLTQLQDLYLSFFGTEAKTYLLIFQNYDEARATGGFIGTYGVLKIDDGKIKKLKIESVYEHDGSVTETIAAPGPMQPTIKKWGMRDANWFIDFPTSARKLLYFFEKGSETADGVIAMTPKLFEQLITLTGPIYMSQYDLGITATNFQEVVQTKTSVDYDKQLNQPKKFLADFSQVLLNRLTDLKKESWFSLFQILQNNLDNRHVMLYSANGQTQNKVSNLGFAGEVLGAELDYLMIAHTNLGGTKTDLDMVRKASLKTKILSDDSVINYLQVQSTNLANESNRNYLRILVPAGAELISAAGFSQGNHLPSASENLKIDPDLANWDRGQLNGNVFVRTEAGKTEFAGWVVTGRGEKTEINLSYSLPFKVKTGMLTNSTSYSMLMQKQPGSLPHEFSHELFLEELSPVWLSPGIVSTDLGLKYNSHSNTDDYWAAVLTND